MLEKYYGILCFLLLQSLSSFALSFEFKGNKWIGAETTIYVNLQGISNSGIPWGSAVKHAIDEWNTKTSFHFDLVPESRNPCIRNGLNSLAFTKDICGVSFNDSTLAVTVLQYKDQQLGPNAIVEADVYVKESVPFDIYDGPRIEPDAEQSPVDFRRTVLHELGHVIGLDHEEREAAIMQPEFGDIYRLQDDDIQGVSLLYGGLSNCKVMDLKFGKTSNALAESDCTVKELTVGGQDESRIDLYQFTLASPTLVDITITSQDLESVIIISDKDLNYLAIDSDSASGCSGRLKTSLSAGDYFLMVNTFDVQIKNQCGLTGEYELFASYSSDSPQFLKTKITDPFGQPNAKFMGRISGNDGQSYGNLFSNKESIDISAAITVDSTHVGERGFFVVAAVIGSQILMQDQSGQFIEVTDPSGNVIPVLEKRLEAFESIDIAKNLIAADFDITEIEVDFYIGYAVESNPARIYYHENPFNLTISSSED